MNFLKQMRSRELIEMSLKTIAAVFVGLILVILMEGMIFNIYMDKIKENKASQYTPDTCIAYCEEVGNDEYRIYLHNTDSGSWHIKNRKESKQSIESSSYKEVVYDSPNAFDVSITNTHYIVISIFVAGIIGFFGWNFYRLNKSYNKLENKFKKSGKIFN